MSRLLDFINSPWAIEPAKLDEIINIYATHLRGDKIDLAAVEAMLGKPLQNAPRDKYDLRDGVAIVPIDGVLAKRANMFSKISGGTSMELVAQDFQDALDNPAVHSIVQRIDSPGGNVEGIQEYANLVYAARNSGKRIVTWVDSKMASAAAWVGVAAPEVYLGAGTNVAGSLGVVMKHSNIKKMEERSGIETTEIYSGKYKRIASDLGPLSEEGRAYLQAQTDYMYSVMVDDVARFRGVSSETVLEKMADGRTFIGQQAIDAGLADGVLSLDALIAHLVAGTSPKTHARMSAGSAAPRAQTDAGAASNLNPKGNDMTITKDFLVANHPEIAEAFRMEGFERGMKDGREAGATAERERIKSVEAAGLPGHETLIETLKYDGKTTAGEAATQVIAAERVKAAGRSAAIVDDAALLNPVKAQPSASGEQPPANAGKSVEERCKAKWEADEKVRAEFASLEGFTAYTKNVEAGHVRTTGPRRAA